MSNRQNGELRNAPKSLSDIQRQVQEVTAILDKCTDELTAVRTILEQGLGTADLHSIVEGALIRNETLVNGVGAALAGLSILNRTLAGELRDRHMIDHQLAAAIEQKEAADHDAMHDGLTGLPNRMLLNDRLKHGIAQAKRHQWSMAVMFLDLDSFSEVNNLHGHAAGDALLRRVAQRLTEESRGDDTVSRFGGDEFIYVAVEVRDERNVALIADRILRTVQAKCTVRLDGVAIDLSVKVSIGISIYPRDGDTADALIRRADEAMYRAKQTGSRYEFWV